MLKHKSVNVHDHVWRQLRINAELSGVAVRDYLTFIILTSQPVQEEEVERRKTLLDVCRSNAVKCVRQDSSPSSTKIRDALIAQ